MQERGRGGGEGPALTCDRSGSSTAQVSLLCSDKAFECGPVLITGAKDTRAH